jgi:hypothetical protein
MTTSLVAQIGNLLYRRLGTGAAMAVRAARGLPIHDTADCQSALRRAADATIELAAVVGDLTGIVELIEREEGIEK